MLCQVQEKSVEGLQYKEVMDKIKVRMSRRACACVFSWFRGACSICIRMTHARRNCCMVHLY